MKKIEHLTNKEHEIMTILWNSDRPMAISEIASKTKTVAPNSMHPMVNSLLAKNFIRVAGNVKLVKTNSRLYAPAVTVDEYVSSQIVDIYRSSNKQMDMTVLMSAFVKYGSNKQRSGEIVAELEHFVAEYKKD